MCVCVCIYCCICIYKHVYCTYQVAAVVGSDIEAGDDTFARVGRHDAARQPWAVGRVRGGRDGLTEPENNYSQWFIVRGWWYAPSSRHH